MSAHVEPVRLGSNYHAAMSRPRHDPLTSLLEIIDNVLGRARWEASIPMTSCHLTLCTFSTGTEFLVALSNTKISHDEFVKCLDQRPKDQEARTHALSVFGDGMKSAHNCLVDGNGNLFLCVQRPSERGGKKEFWLARYGKALDDALGSSDVNKAIAPWDPEKRTVSTASANDVLKTLSKNSPFEGKTVKDSGVRLNEMFKMLTKTAEMYGYEDVFMQVIGPIATRKVAGDRETGLVSLSDDGELMSVWRPNPDKKHYDHEDAAAAIVQHYLPPDCVLATKPKPHAFAALHNKPNPNTKLDLFMQGERVNLAANVWSKVATPPSEVVEVIVKGVKVAELQVKQLDRLGFSFQGGVIPLHEQCGALVAMEGGRILNRSPHAFVNDALCTQSNLHFTPMQLYMAFYNGSVKSKKTPLFKDLLACMDEECISKKQVRRATRLLASDGSCVTQQPALAHSAL